MTQYILDVAYKVTESNGVSAGIVVVQGPRAGECKLPETANAGAILGVTVHGQSDQSQNVTVRKAGIARVVSAGPIPVGSPVNIADRYGRVKAVNEPKGTKVECLGFAETAADKEHEVLEIFLSLHQRTT